MMQKLLPCSSHWNPLGRIPLLKFHTILQKVLYFVQDLPAAQQSDALRLALLAKYGGVWALDSV